MTDAPAGSVRVALIQMRCNEEPGANLERARSAIAEAASQGARIICLPELFRTPYFCRTETAAHFDLAEPIPGPTTALLAESARTHQIVVIAGLFERRAAGLFHNSAVVLDADGSLAGTYRKLHLPHDPYFYEKFYFTPGDLGVGVFSTRFARIGVLICWDQWFPEAARLAALKGAQILFYPTAIGWLSHEKEHWGTQQQDMWQTVQRGHAIANGLFVAACNRVGVEGELEFWGSSFVADPMGQLLVVGGSDESILVVDCPLDQIEAVRRDWPFLRDRRIDAYQGLDRRYLSD
jgi:N-carbamoylputrescine amidase